METWEKLQGIEHSTAVLLRTVEAVVSGNYENAPDPIKRLAAVMEESGDEYAQIKAAGQIHDLGLQAAIAILDIAGVKEAAARRAEGNGGSLHE